MQIVDLENKTITVTDLDAAIKQAKAFKGFKHTDKAFAEMDKRNKAYWTDIYKKLLNLKKQPKQ